MVKLNAKAMEILTEVRHQILTDHFGHPGERFVGIREIAADFSVQTKTAQDIFEVLREEGLLMLFGKKHYLSHGTIPSDSPLGKIRQERKWIVIVCDHFESYYVPTFADRVADYLKKEGYTVVIYLTTEATCRQDLLKLYDMGVQGLLVFAEYSLTHKICRMSNIPCVSIGYDCTEARADSVLSGGSKHAKRLVDMMLEQGCKRFYFATPRREMIEEKDIFKAFVDRLHERNVDLDSDIIITEKEVKNSWRFLCRKLFAKNEKIGIVCTNEQVTQRIVKCCGEDGITVPNEIMLATFRTKSPMNHEWQEIITVEENIEKEAVGATEILLKRIHGDRSPHKVIIVEPKVINRIEERRKEV